MASKQAEKDDFFDDAQDTTNKDSSKQATNTTTTQSNTQPADQKAVAKTSSSQQPQQQQQQQQQQQYDSEPESERNAGQLDTPRDDDNRSVASSRREKEVVGDWYYEGMQMTQRGGDEREKTFTGLVLKKTLKESKQHEPTIENIEDIEVENGYARVKISWKPPPKIKREKIKFYEIQIIPEDENQAEQQEDDAEEESRVVHQTFETETTAEFSLEPSTDYLVRVLVTDLYDEEYLSDDKFFTTQSELGNPEIDEISELRSCDPNVKKVMITWVPPSGVEEEDIFEYYLFIKSLTDSTESEIVTCSPQETSRICYLQPESKYEVAIKASTKMGPADSESEEFETGEALGKPSITKIEQVSEDKENNIEVMKVSWSPPDMDEEQILKYEVCVKYQNPGKKPVEGPTCLTKSYDKECTSGEFDLIPKAKYTFQVTIFAVYAEAKSDPKTVCADPALGKPKIEKIFEIIPETTHEKKQVIVFWEPAVGVEQKDIKEYKVRFTAPPKKKDDKPVTWLRSVNASKTHAILWLEPKTSYKFSIIAKTDVVNGTSEEQGFTTAPPAEPGQQSAPQKGTTQSKKTKTGASGTSTSKKDKSKKPTQYSNKSKEKPGNDKKVDVVDYNQRMIGSIYVNKTIYDDIIKSQKKS